MDGIKDLILEKVENIPGQLVEFAPGLILAVVIFIVGRFIVRKASSTTVKASQKIPNIDVTLAKFFGSLVLFVGMAAVIIFALSAMNVNLAFLATIVAALVVALGFALQESLGDFASGIMLAVFRPFKVGEEVEIAGEHGVVQETGLFATRLVTRDNIQISVGNGSIFGNTIKNYYDFGTRRLDMDFGVSYDANLDEAIKAIISVTDGDKRIHSEPAPWAKVTGLGDSSVSIQLRAWCDADDHRGIKMDLSQRVKTALDKAGIEIPYEHNMIVRRAG